jgi:hypothetical protein
VSIASALAASKSTKPSPGAFLAALQPAGLAATLTAAERLESDREAALKQWRLGVERAHYEAQRAERRHRAVDPDNRLVARGLEREWEERLRALDAAKAELERRERERPRVISEAERNRLLALGPDLAAVWNAPTTTPRDRKELLRTLFGRDVVLNILARQRDGDPPRPVATPAALTLAIEPAADCARYDRLRHPPPAEEVWCGAA